MIYFYVNTYMLPVEQERNTKLWQEIRDLEHLYGDDQKKEHLT